MQVEAYVYMYNISIHIVLRFLEMLHSKAWLEMLDAESLIKTGVGNFPNSK